MKTEQDTLVEKLDALLDVERRALLDGDLEALAGLAEDKEQIIDALNALEFADGETLSPVNDKMKRNQALLEQALGGIRAVARRLAEIRQTRRSFDIYDRMGHKNRIEGTAESSFEKRA
jgi:hypothetical protein